MYSKELDCFIEQKTYQQQATVIPTKAMLLVDIEYKKDNRHIVIPTGTIVWVDTYNSIMFFCGDHIHIMPEEYLLNS